MNDTAISTLNFDSKCPITQASLYPDDQAMIDQTLQLVADHQAMLSRDLDLPTAKPSLNMLRQSPLGCRLHRLADAARGQFNGESLRVREDAEHVITTLLQPLAESDHDVPEWFWQTEIGQMLTTALYRTYGTDQLLSVAHGAERLDEDRASIQQLIAIGTLTAVRDETGKPFVLVAEIERLRTIASAFDEPSLPAADSLVATRAA